MLDTQNKAATLATEVAAHAALRLVADMPGQIGRLRVARAVTGHAIQGADDDLIQRLTKYSVAEDWSVREMVELVDALIEGGLIARTVGQRPTLVLTLPGFRALEALQGNRGASDVIPTIHACR